MPLICHCFAILAIIFTTLTSTLPSLAQDSKPPRPEVKTLLDRVELKDGDTFVFLGDSITHRCQYTQYVEDYFYTRQPGDRIHFHNAGISGDTGGDALERFEDDVAPFKPKYVTVLIGMNDGGYREFNPDFFQTFKNNMTGLMDNINGIGAKPILITPTMYDSRARRLYCEPGEPRDTYYNGVLALYGAWVREQADVRAYGFVDMYAPLNNITAHQRKQDAGWSMIKDSFHPDPSGMAVMAGSIIEDVINPSVVSDVNLRFAKGKWGSTVENAEVSEITHEPKTNTLTFTILEKALPWVIPADAAEGFKIAKLAERFSKERLAVSGLPAGDYELKIDDQPVGQWSEAQLALGIELQSNDKTPQYQQAAKVAALNKHRNEAFLFKARDTFQQIKGRRHDVNKATFDKAPDLEDKKAELERVRVEIKASVAILYKQAKEVEDQICTINQPKPHRYEISPVK